MPSSKSAVSSGRTDLSRLEISSKSRRSLDPICWQPQMRKCIHARGWGGETLFSTKAVEVSVLFTVPLSKDIFLHTVNLLCLLARPGAPCTEKANQMHRHQHKRVGKKHGRWTFVEWFFQKPVQSTSKTQKTKEEQMINTFSSGFLPFSIQTAENSYLPQRGPLCGGDTSIRVLILCVDFWKGVPPPPWQLRMSVAVAQENQMEHLNTDKRG